MIPRQTMRGETIKMGPGKYFSPKQATTVIKVPVRSFCPFAPSPPSLRSNKNLSALATANTYIVSSAGKYKFKATVKGNGGVDPLTGATATTIDPASIAGVKVLWELGRCFHKIL